MLVTCIKFVLAQSNRQFGSLTTYLNISVTKLLGVLYKQCTSMLDLHDHTRQASEGKLKTSALKIFCNA